MPLIQVTYFPGGSIGNLVWVWHTDVRDIDSALQSSQQIIENLKKDIP